MNATVQRSTESFERLIPKRQATSRRPPAPVWPNASAIPRPLPWPDESLPIEIVEGPLGYKLIAPLCGIDPHKIYVFAMPRLLLVEIRYKTSICHELATALVTERIDRRISREFDLPNEIEQGATTVQVCGESLEITVRKTQQDKQASWSQLIHFDTRSSLGCV